MADSVTLFVRTGDPVCDAAQKYLAEKQVEYPLRDVASDAAAAALLTSKLGRVAVPTFQIGDRLVVGFDPMQLVRFLPTAEDEGEKVVFGAGVRTLSPVVLRERGIPAPSGVEVGEVREGTPAADAGVQKGDVILGIGSYDLTAGADQFRTALGAKKPGDSMSLRLWREAEITVEVTFPAPAEVRASQ